MTVPQSVRLLLVLLTAFSSSCSPSPPALPPPPLPQRLHFLLLLNCFCSESQIYNIFRRVKDYAVLFLWGFFSYICSFYGLQNQTNINIHNMKAMMLCYYTTNRGRHLALFQEDRRLYSLVKHVIRKTETHFNHRLLQNTYIHWTS